jgi:MoxR-like ATPase
MAVADIQAIQTAAKKVLHNVQQVVVGKDAAVELTIVALLCEGHVLIEDVPGLGKTVLAKALAKSLGCQFRRIQCTPDLLPSDITGTYVFNQRTSDFEFRPGPVMAQVVLADEINRATPRTQSALLEAMQERQVTTEGHTKPLPRPFIVLATQNPVELEGTFPLPEAQLDRFMLKITMGYPTVDEDRRILGRFRSNDPIVSLEAVIAADELLHLQQLCREVHVAGDVEDYIIAVVHASRDHEAVAIGASPRAMLALFQASQALAAIRGRSYVSPDDVKYMTVPVLAHRIMAKSESWLQGHHAERIMQEVLERVSTPVEEDFTAEAADLSRSVKHR